MEDEPALQVPDVRWMTQFNELQQQQVTALIQQNENQKTQLEILAMQLEIEKQRQFNRHHANGQVSTKKEVDGGVDMQQLLPLPVQDSPLQIHSMQSQGFEMGDFSSEAQQNFEPRYSAFSMEPPQQNHNQQLYQSQHQENVNPELPRINNLGSPDNQLFMALGGCDLPPLLLSCSSLPGSSTPANNRLNIIHEYSAYSTPRYPSIMPDPVLRSNNRQTNRTPDSSIANTHKEKRPRLFGPALPEYSSPAAANVANGSSYHGQQSQALQSYAAGVGKLAFCLTRKDLEDCIMELALREEDMSTVHYHNAAFNIVPKQGLVRSSLMSKLARNSRKVVVFNKDIWPMSMGLSKAGELGSFRKVPLECMSCPSNLRKNFRVPF